MNNAETNITEAKNPHFQKLNILNSNLSFFTYEQPNLENNKFSESETAFIKLIFAYETKDYSTLTRQDLLELVNKRLLRPETATRLLKECSNVS